MARLNIEITATGVNRTDKAIKSVSNSVDRLDAEINSVQKTLGAFSRQQMVLQGQMRNLNNSFNQGVISQDRYESESKQLGLQLSSVGGRIQNLNSSLSSLKATQNQLADSTRSLGTSSGQLQAYSNDFTSGIRSSNAVAVEFSRVVQDMPYGMQGVANNLQQLTQNWSYYARSAREAAAAQGQTVSTMALMKGTLSSLLSPLNLITLGISLITAGWVAYEKYQQRANKAMREGQKVAKDYAETLNDLSRSLYNASQSYGKDIARMQTLMAVVKSATVTQDQRNDALKELQEMYPAVFRNYNTETILTEKASEAYKELTSSIIAAANARAAEGLIAEKASAQLAIDEEIKKLTKSLNLEKDRLNIAKEYSRLPSGSSLTGVPNTNDRETLRIGTKVSAIQDDINQNLLDRANLQEDINSLAAQALNNQLKVNDAIDDTVVGTDRAAASTRDFVDAIARVFDFETSSASLINVSYTNAEIQKVENEYKKMLNNVDRLEREGLKRNESNEGERTRIVEEGIRQRAEIQRAQTIAVADVIYRQETVAIEKSLQAQRDLYENYENWRLELGEEAANKRYEAELKSVRGFYARLESEMAGLMMKSMGVEGLNDAEKDRLDALTKIFQDFNKDREAEENKHLMSLLKLYGTFEDNRKRLAEQYYKDIESLNEEQRKNRARKYADDLAKYIEDEIENSDAFRNMDIALDFSGIRKSKEAVKLAKDFLDDFFANLKPTSAQEKAAAEQLQRGLNRSLKKIDLALDANAFDVVTDLVTSFGDLVDSAQDFGESLGKSLKTVGRMVSEVGNMSKSLGSVMGDAGAGLGQLGGWAGIAGAVFGVVGGIFEAIDARQRKRDEERAERLKYMEDYRIKQIERQTKLLQGQYALIGDIYGVGRLTAYARVLEDINKEQERLLKIQQKDGLRPKPDQYINDGRYKLLQNTGIKELDRLIARYNKALAEGAEMPKASVFMSPGKTILDEIELMAKGAGVALNELGIDFRNLSQMDVVELRSLIDTGGLDEATAAFVETLITLAETEIAAIKALQEELTGTSFEALGDGLVDIFTRGDSAMEDFEKNFDELMRKSLVQSLKRSIMTDALKDWYEQFAGFAESDGGLDDSEVDELRRGYERIGEQIKANAENLERATGISLSDPAESDRAAKGLTGSIQRLSEQTGSELTGLYRAGFELNKQELGYVQRLAISNDGILVAINESSEYLADIASTNAEIAEHTVYLEEIAESLDQVVKNTGGKSQRDLG